MPQMTMKYDPWFCEPFSNWKRRTQRINSNCKNTYTSGVFQKTNIKENMKRPQIPLLRNIRNKEYVKYIAYKTKRKNPVQQ